MKKGSCVFFVGCEVCFFGLDDFGIDHDLGR